jgi:hypothetical protein
MILIDKRKSKIRYKRSKVNFSGDLISFKYSKYRYRHLLGAPVFPDP